MAWLRSPAPVVRRSCFVCGRDYGVRVWYSGIRRVKSFFAAAETRRVYACPPCYYDLPESERTGWIVETKP
ncbi:MAG TPA: hypothetical protein VM681_05035 [Candidatus Thermoplasmatota archaeon]|nr:hypothetical protein [Candidatus Thermoplasmatota archaeon]